jgi:hypothetical protein
MAKTYENRAIAEIVRKRLERGKGKPYGIVEWHGGWKVLPKKDADLLNDPLPEVNVVPMSEDILAGVENLKAHAPSEFDALKELHDKVSSAMALPFDMVTETKKLKAADFAPAYGMGPKKLVELYPDADTPVMTVGVGQSITSEQLIKNTAPKPKTPDHKIKVLREVMKAAFPWVDVAVYRAPLSGSYEITFKKKGLEPYTVVMTQEFVAGAKHVTLVDYLHHHLPHEILAAPEPADKQVVPDFGKSFFAPWPKKAPLTPIQKLCKIIGENYPWLKVEHDYDIVHQKYFISLAKKGMSPYVLPAVTKQSLEMFAEIDIANQLEKTFPAELKDPGPNHGKHYKDNPFLPEDAMPLKEASYIKVIKEDGTEAALKVTKPMTNAIKKLLDDYNNSPIPEAAVKKVLNPWHAGKVSHEMILGIDMGSGEATSRWPIRARCWSTRTGTSQGWPSRSIRRPRSCTTSR